VRGELESTPPLGQRQPYVEGFPVALVLAGRQQSSRLFSAGLPIPRASRAVCGAGREQ
jgi:hypothetical protein